MMTAVDIVLDHLNATLLIFLAGVTMASIVVKKPSLRVIGGLLALVATVLWHISTRTAYDWTVSAVERTSAPGLLLLGALIYSSMSGRLLVRSAEFRFGTFVLIAAGLVLYPGAVGLLNADTYVPGYSGYLLPAVVALLLAIMIYRGFALSALSLNAGIAAYLLGLGRSLNLWDYVVDPMAGLLAVVSWIAILGAIAFDKFTSSKPVTERL